MVFVKQWLDSSLWDRDVRIDWPEMEADKSWTLEVAVPAGSRVLRVVSSIGVAIRHTTQDLWALANWPMVWRFDVARLGALDPGETTVNRQTGACAAAVVLYPDHNFPNGLVTTTFRTDVQQVNAWRSDGSTTGDGESATYTATLTVGRLPYGVDNERYVYSVSGALRVLTERDQP